MSNPCKIVNASVLTCLIVRVVMVDSNGRRRKRTFHLGASSGRRNFERLCQSAGRNVPMDTSELIGLKVELDNRGRSAAR